MNKYISGKRRFIIVVLIYSALVAGVLIWYLWFSKSSAATPSRIYYVDATNGSDTADGRTPQTAWKTVSKVNREGFYRGPNTPRLIDGGDQVLFKRGEKWTNTNVPLIPASDSSGSYVTYGAYGQGDKPVLSLARDRNLASDWVQDGANIWQTGKSTFIGPEMLPNPSFDTDINNWGFYVEPDSEPQTRAIASASWTDAEYFGEPGALKIDITKVGNSPNDIQLTTKSASNGGFVLGQDKYYEFSYYIKSSVNFPFPVKQNLAVLRSLTGDSIFNDSDIKNPPPANITTSWQKVSMVFISRKDASDAVVTFALGFRDDSDDINYGPFDNSQIYFDQFSLREISAEDCLYADIANVLMDNKASIGKKVFNESQLVNQGDFWYDTVSKVLRVKSTVNPAQFYSVGIELVLDDFGVDFGSTYGIKSYINFNNLHVTLANFGFWGNAAHHIIIEDCDVSYIGGGFNSYSEAGVPRRDGNGIEFWNNTHDNLVQRNRVWQVYDTGITTQGLQNTSKSNEFFYNNIVWDCGLGFELWQQGITGSPALNNIRVENNTFARNGYGWGSGEQRPDGDMAMAFLYGLTQGTKTNISIRNNVFGKSFNRDMVRFRAISNLDGLNFDYNIYEYNPSEARPNPLLVWIVNEDKQYRAFKTSSSVLDFDDWKLAYGKDTNSFAEKNTTFLNPSFHLHPQSKGIDNGATISYIPTDFLGATRPKGNAYDIGAYEESPYTFPTVSKQVDRAMASSGDEIKYTINFTNITSVALQNVAVNDIIPVGSTLVSGSITGGGQVIGNMITWNIVSLAPNASVQYEFKVTAN